MTSKVEIFNKALYLLGKSRVDSPTEDNENARVLASIYDSCLDELLVTMPWNFAVTRQTLTVITGAVNLSPFDYVYQLPQLPYCLRVLSINNDVQDNYIIEGRYLYTDELSVNVSYIGRITDPQQFSPEFVKSLSLLMASESANALTGSSSTGENLYGLYQRHISQAATANANEGYLTPNVESEVINSQI